MDPSSKNLKRDNLHNQLSNQFEPDNNRPLANQKKSQNPMENQSHESIHEPLIRKEIPAQEFVGYPNDQNQLWYPRCLNCIGTCCIPFAMFFPCFCSCISRPMFIQETAQCGLLERFGRYKKVLSPGLHIINPISEKVVEVNLQTKFIEFQQTAFSKDNVQFQIKTIVFYRVIDPAKLVYKLGQTDRELVDCVSQISKGVVRGLIGDSSLQEVIEKREEISRKLKIDMNYMLQVWGIYIETASIKNLKLNKDLEDVLAAVPKTKRIMQAFLVGYRADIEVGKLLKQMSEILDSRAAMQIRYLDLVQTIISSSNQKTIIISTSNVREYSRVQQEGEKKIVVR